VARPHTAARLAISALSLPLFPIYDRRAIRFAQKRTRFVMNPSSGGLLHRQCRIADPDQLRDAVYGTTMMIDRLSPSGAPSRLEQFQSMAGWGVDVAKLHCRLHAQGPLAPGCVAIVLILRANGSSLCGVKTEDGAVVVIPPGTTLAANVISGFSYVGTTVPASVWAAAQSIESGIVTERQPDQVSMRRLPSERLTAIERRWIHISSATPELRAKASSGVR